MIKNIFFALVGVLGILAAIVFVVAAPSISRDPNPVQILVPKGLAQGQIIQLLKDNGVIRSATVFKMLSRIAFRSSRFRHGVYLFEKNHYFKILNQLSQGLTYRFKVTLPEGWTAYQVAERLAKNGVIIDPEAFALIVKEGQLEGMLYPETYYFEPASDSKSVIEEMIREFHENYNEEFQKRAAVMNMTDRQILTLASIIEREARIDSERPTISSVYHNRLKKRKLLEADPTVQYAIGEGRFWKERLTYKDLNTNSPYNTYRKSGLPPGPICNPGVESIQAALYPAETPFLYFVADPNGSGTHHFTQTYDQHMQKQRDLGLVHRRKTAARAPGVKSQ